MHALRSTSAHSETSGHHFVRLFFSILSNAHSSGDMDFSRLVLDQDPITVGI